jgi:hypothetical protein
MQKYSPWILPAALSAALIAPAAAQTQIPPDQGAAANVRQSQQYEQVIRSNPAFRAKRMQEECGPITDPELHASCVASFGGEGAPRPSKGGQH